MQSASSKIWTRVSVSISDDDNHYTTGTSTIISILHSNFPDTWDPARVQSSTWGLIKVLYLFKTTFAFLEIKFLTIQPIIPFSFDTIEKISCQLWMYYLSQSLDRIPYLFSTVMAKVWLCCLEVIEFQKPPWYDVHFWTKILGKGRNLLIVPGYGLNSITAVLLYI